MEESKRRFTNDYGDERDRQPQMSASEESAPVEREREKRGHFASPWLWRAGAHVCLLV